VSNPVVPPSSEPGLGSSDPATGHAYLPPVPEERPSLRSKLLKALAVVVAVAVVLVVRSMLLGDEARAAEVGDCVDAGQDVSAQGSTEAQAEVVDCGSADAVYVVVAKVPGVSGTDSSACDQYFKEDEQFFVYSSDSSTGEFLLCLRPAA
jgi:hypothetical protein